MEHLLATWGYLALFVATFIASMALPIGSEVAIGYAGALASGHLSTGPHDHLKLGIVIVVAALGELSGSIAGYAIGRFGGRPLVDRVGKYILLTKKDLDRAEHWVATKGESFVLFGRFIPLLRSFVSIAAGLAEVRVTKFIVFTVIGSTIWCATLSSIGYSLGSSWHHVITDFNYAGYVAAVLFVIAIASLFLHRIHVLRKERVMASQHEGA